MSLSHAGLGLSTGLQLLLLCRRTEPFLSPVAVLPSTRHTRAPVLASGGREGGRRADAETREAFGATARRRGTLNSSVSGLRRRAARGFSEGDEGIADFSSLINPAKEKDYGDHTALQYGVSVGAEASGAGASHHFFSADTRVVFGVNALEIGLVELYDMGLKRAFIVTGWNQARADPVVWELLPRGFDLKFYSVSAEPSISDVAKGASLALEHRADCVVAVGGASVIDAAKVIAAIAYADKDSAEATKRLLAAANKPRETAMPVDDSAAPLLGPIPLVAVPLVAGAGSEVTPMATILDDQDPLEPEKVTVGFHNTAAAMPAPFMAIVEPRLMMRIPLEIAWPRAFVALAGCLEAYVAGRGFVPDLLSHQAIQRVSRCLARDLGFRGPLYQEREDIAFAGVIRGLVASRTEWSFLQRLATAVSVVCNAPYANCMARLFPRVLQAQIAALRREEEEYADSAHRRRRTRSRGGDYEVDNGGSAESGDGESSSSKGSGKGSDRGKTYSDDYNDRACAALLKYQRVAGFVLGEGRGGRVQDVSEGVGSEVEEMGEGTAGAPVLRPSSPEDVVEWLDERLLDKNIPPLYCTGLRLEHVPSILETLLHSAADGGGRDGLDWDGDLGGANEARETEAIAFGGLREATVREILVGETGRRRDGGEDDRGWAREAAGAALSGKGEVGGRTQIGPWQKK